MREERSPFKKEILQVKMVPSEKFQIEQDAENNGFEKPADFLMFLYERYGKEDRENFLA